MSSLPKQIADLIERFNRNRDDYHASRYNEAQLRQEFVNPFFKALGWDVDNVSGYGEAYKDVIHEDSIKVGGETKAPDYCFRVGGTRKFFVETKRPSVSLKDDATAAYQLRRYAWSATLPLSILTDFEEFAVYDCRIKPVQTDKASAARIEYLTCNQYAVHWHKIASVFSREAVLRGSFDKYAESERAKTGTAEVDAAFLMEIEIWRDILARNLALRNLTLTPRELNFCVQKTIDRIIFLRICEGRGIEPYGQLAATTNGNDVYKRLCDIFRRADYKYNSGLFHFDEEKDRSEPPDVLSLSLSIDDRVLKEILRGLYYPESPYEFSVLPADILGHVYEQFLGRVIRLTPGHQAKVEEKPEVKKAGGVYYTPAYIVSYLVKSTVGGFLEERTPKEASKLRILDPACGSGSFLLGAYQYLLDWHRAWYESDGPEKHPKALYQAEGGDWRLTVEERKRILLNCIYGVDIDPQAVEVTKLSLLLKVLENETEQTLSRQPQLFHRQRALPDLGSNIKCGNSLISSEYYKARPMSLLEDDVFRVNCFDWWDNFPVIRKAGGFDVVIGNPPYRRELDYKDLMDDIAGTPFGARYRCPRMDLWYYFVHRALELLRPDGVLSFIVNAYWVSGTGSEKLIQALRESAQIEEIFFLGKLKVFSRVSGQHMLLRISKTRPGAATEIKLAGDQADNDDAEPFVRGTTPVVSFKRTHRQLFAGNKIDLEAPSDHLLSKLQRWPRLGTLGRVRQGIAENPASINRKTNRKFGGGWEVGEGVFALTADQLKKLRLPSSEKVLLRPYYDLKDLGRYRIAPTPSLTLIYSTRKTCPDIARFPRLREHLERFRTIMEKRRETKKGAVSWWHLHWPRDEEIWRSAKILAVQMAVRPAFVSSFSPVYVPFSVNVFVPDPATAEDIRYITGLLNSRLMWKWYRHRAKRRGIGLEVNGNVLSDTPMRTIDFSDRPEANLHDRIVCLVSRMMELQCKMENVRTEYEVTSIARRIEATDRDIDTIVYELYGLTQREIEALESALQ